jgi:pimeloyl-ACP methyl ester carboxylesterase
MRIEPTAVQVGRHAVANVEPGVRLHYVTHGEGERTVVLLHGFPQTWWEWRYVIPLLADAGFRVLAPDYRGAGHSQRTQNGYESPAKVPISQAREAGVNPMVNRKSST